MAKQTVVDSDGHILEPTDLWEKYLEPKYRDRAIRLREDERGLEYIEIDRKKSVMLRGGTLAALGGAYQDPRELITPGKVKYWEGAKRTPGAIDPDARVREMDAEGIDAAILYPTIGIIWEGEVADAELSAAYCRAYNNYLIDFCSKHSDRLIPIAHVNLLDVDMAVAEVKRVTGKAKGIFTTPVPRNGRSVGDRYYDPFWAACEAAHLPVATHVQVRPDFLGSGMNVEQGEHGRDPVYQRSGIWLLFMQLTEDSKLGMNCVFQGGVLERFPKLQYVILEIGCGFLPSWIERADGKWDMFGFSTGMKHRPSELLLRNCSISAEPDEACIPEIARQVGAKRLLWATDYPHIDAYNNPVKELREHIAPLPAEDQEWILGKSAVELYRL
jgi:predicted TIM-barrel fold metal-dependent hydrolase